MNIIWIRQAEQTSRSYPNRKPSHPHGKLHFLCQLVIKIPRHRKRMACAYDFEVLRGLGLGEGNRDDGCLDRVLTDFFGGFATSPSTSKRGKRLM